MNRVLQLVLLMLDGILTILMKVVVLYRPRSEFARRVEEFVHDLQTTHNVDDRHLQVIDIDTRDGSAIASLYDLMTQPAILITGDDGSYIKSWQGSQLPQLEEVASYAIDYQ